MRFMEQAQARNEAANATASTAADSGAATVEGLAIQTIGPRPDGGTVLEAL